jgi:phenylacetate-CoA ligase
MRKTYRPAPGPGSPGERRDEPLSENQRFPLLNNSGRKLMQSLREHPHAPRFNFPCGDRLDRKNLRRVQAFADTVAKNPDPHENRDRLSETKLLAAQTTAHFCYAQVPFFRRRGPIPEDFSRIPTTSRTDIAREPWSFVPDHQDLDQLLVYYTSGTTGTKAHILSHPIVPSMFLAMLDAALAAKKLTLPKGPGKVALMQVCSQTTVYTHVTVSGYLHGAAYIKINLNPADWKSPADIVAYVDAVKPPIVTGDPITLNELAMTNVTWKPQAMVSSAMSLHPATRRKLEERFCCPVLDVYSLNECRFVAARWDDGPFLVLAPDLLVETLTDDPAPAPPDHPGEITLTCDRNPFLPLLRYRTGDWGILKKTGDGIFIHNLIGRPPVLFRTPSGGFINNIDIVQLLKPFPVFRYHLHQTHSGKLLLTIDGLALDQTAIREQFRRVFSDTMDLEIVPFPAGMPARKQPEFTSDLPTQAPDRPLEYVR